MIDSLDSADTRHHQRRYYGLYRGAVVNNKDPQGLGKVEVRVPDVLGTDTLWAMPSSPHAGPGVGFLFLPPQNANVWIAFEAGDPQYPVWTGGFWSEGQMPVSPAVEEMKILKTDVFTLAINTSGKKEVTLSLNVGEQNSPRLMTLTMNADGIEISHDKQTVIKLTATNIELNNGSSAQARVAAQEIELHSNQNKIVVGSDRIALQKSPAEISLSATGIALENGFPSIKMSAQNVSINNGALEVT